MPIYEYHCERCGKTFEVMQKFSDASLSEHEGCGGHVERLISAPAFQFKGSGWYATDYARPQSSKPGDSAPNGDKAESKLSDSKTEKPATETKSESKSESKTESKPTSTVKKD